MKKTKTLIISIVALQFFLATPSHACCHWFHSFTHWVSHAAATVYHAVVQPVVHAVENVVDKIKEGIEKVKEIERAICGAVGKIDPILAHMNDFQKIFNTITNSHFFQDFEKMVPEVKTAANHIQDVINQVNGIRPLEQNIESFCRDASHNNPAVVVDALKIIPKVCPDARRAENLINDLNYFKGLIQKIEKAHLLEKLEAILKGAGHADLADKIKSAEGVAKMVENIDKTANDYKGYLDKVTGVCSKLHM